MRIRHDNMLLEFILFVKLLMIIVVFLSLSL